MKEMTDCSKCRFRNCCTLVWDYGSLYCNDYEEPKPNHIFKGDIYLIATEKGTIPFRAMWNGEYFTDGFEKLKVIAWMPLPAMPKPYKENKHE